MFHVEEVLTLKEDEQILAIARRHPFTMLPGLFFSLLFLVVPFFFLFNLFSMGWPGVVIFCCILMIGLAIALQYLILWDADVFIVTNFRLVEVQQKNLWSRVVIEAPMTIIQDISWSSKGLLQTMFHYGSVNILTASSSPITADRISRPRMIHELVNEIRHVMEHPESSTPPVAVVKASSVAPVGKAESLLEKLSSKSPQELERLERLLEREQREAAAEACFVEPKEKTDEA